MDVVDKRESNELWRRGKEALDKSNELATKSFELQQESDKCRSKAYGFMSESYRLKTHEETGQVGLFIGKEFG